MAVNLTAPPLPEPKAGESISKLAHPALLRIAERYTRITPLAVGLAPILREQPDHVSPESWNLHPIEVRDREIYMPEMKADLKELTPQALLRDLHRVERQENVMRLVPVGDPALTDPWNHGKTLAAFKREPLPDVQSSLVALREADFERRRFLFEDWKPIKSDDEPRVAFNIQPFGMSGEDPNA